MQIKLIFKLYISIQKHDFKGNVRIKPQYITIQMPRFYLKGGEMLIWVEGCTLKCDF